MKTAMMRRFQSLIDNFDIPPDEVWQFDEQLAQKDLSFFRPLIRRHQILTIEYSVFCASLAQNFLRDPDSENLTEELAAALGFAELLIYIYQNYLSVPREVERLRKDQKIYRQLLAERGYQFNNSHHETANSKASPSQTIRNLTVTVNFPRQLALRSKRVLDALAPVIKQVEHYGQFVALMNKFANPVLAQLAWIFFVPRWSTNVLMLGKHLIPGFWMSEKEAELEWFLRLEAQLKRRWFELCNDTAWLSLGIVGCVLVTSPVLPYLTLALFMFDIVLAIVRARLEINRLENLRAEYQLMKKEATTPEEKQAIERMQNHLEARMNYERKRLMVRVVSTTALFTMVCLTLPFIAVNPIIPLVAAILMVAITLAAYLADRWIEKQKPSDKIDCLADAIAEKPPAVSQVKQGFFHKKNKAEPIQSSYFEYEGEMEEYALPLG